MQNRLTRILLLAVVACTPVLLFVIPGRTSDTPLVISELRFRGPNGANDEFVEIYNQTNSDVTVNATDGSSGYAVAASDGVIRFVIPNGTVIPARGHYLGANTIGYSLGSYPAGDGNVTTPDATFNVDIPDNNGVALFTSSSNLTLGNRLDAVGSVNVADPLYREGFGLPALIPFNVDYSFVRRVPAVGDAGLPQDSDDNATDFLFVDTNGTDSGAGQRLGAPGPENLSGPRTLGANIANSKLDPAQANTDFPNVFRNSASDPANNSTFGTLSIRRTFPQCRSE